MFKNKALLAIVVFFSLIGILGYFAGLTIDVTRDAGKYATVAKEIYQNGNFINITVHGEPYDQKPPLLFWLGAFGFSIGGISNFWFKLPVLLLVFLGIYWAFRLGESLYNRKIGGLTAIILSTAFIYPLYTMDIHTDTPLQAFVTLTLWQLYEFLKNGKTRNLIFGFIGMGLAMLSKGPVGAAIPAFAVVGHFMLKKDFKQFLDYRWYLGILLALLIVSPALIGLMNQFGLEGLKFFFWDNMVGRITGSYVQAVNDPVFYFHNLLYQLFPWSLLFYMAAFLDLKTLVKNRFKSEEYFTFTGIWIYFIVLNASTSQLPNYVFSIIPLMAVLLAKWISKATEYRNILWKSFFGVQSSVFVMLLATIAVFMLWLFPGAEIHYWLLLLAGILSSVYIFLKVKDRLILLVAPSAIGLLVLVVLLNGHIFPYIFSFQAPPKAAKFYTENKLPGEKLYNYHYGQYELFFYSEPQAEQLNDFEEMKNVAGKPGNWIFTDETGYKDIQSLDVRPQKIIIYKHLYLNRGGKFINPATRENVLFPMYLIRY